MNHFWYRFRCVAHLTFFLLAALVSQAQPEPYYFSLPATGKAEAVPGAATSAWYVAQVLDLRTDRSRVGTIRRGLDNLAAPALLTQAVPTAILAYCQQQLPARPGSRPVVLRLLHVSVSEDVRATSETGEAELVGDFLSSQPDSTYHVLRPVAELLRRGGMDVTLHHPANLGRVLNQALAQLAALPASSPAIGTALTRTEVYQGQRGLPALAVLTQAPTATGVYQSLDDFRANKLTSVNQPLTMTPSGRSKRGKVGSSEELEANLLYVGTGQPARQLSAGSVWGLSDGKRRYIAHQGYFYPLFPGVDGISATFVALAPPDPAGAASRALVGGLLGGAVGGAIAGASAPGAGVATHEVHLLTGRVLAQPDSSPADSDTGAGFLYLYRTDDGSNEPVLIQVNNRTVASLLPQQCVRLPAPNRSQELVLCLRSANNAAAQAALTARPDACRPVAPDYDAPVFIECQPGAAGGSEPTFKIVPLRIGAMQVKRLPRVQPTQP